MMRNYQIQTIINFLKLIPKKGYWRKWLWNYGWQWIKSLGTGTNSTIYSIGEIGQFRNLIYKLGEFDKNWFVRIFEPETKGVRAWEYGKLLTELNKLPKGKILDVGAGGSLMADYLAGLGWKVTSLDLQQQMEKRYQSKNSEVEYVVGDMTKMKFENKSFDVVMSISAIEHLESWIKTQKALDEMKRVVKANGKIYISTDFYLKRQTTDNWNQNLPLSPPLMKGGGHYGSFKWSKLRKMAKIINAKININIEEKKLIKSASYSNFRGRYFTTIFLEGQP